MFCEKCGCTLPDGVSFCTQCGASLNSNAATPTAEAAGLRTKLEVLKYQLGILQEVNCSNQENQKYRKMLQENKPLPNGILCRTSDGSVEYASFYKVERTALSKDELAEYLQYKQLKSIITIKKCMVFFTVLTVISLACGFILALSMLS